MSLSDILPIVLIILFWAILFVCVFTFWRMNTALHAPADAQHELHSDEAEHAHVTSAH